MGHKIFVSYKFADDQVKNLNGQQNSTVRDYVDELENYFDSSSHIYTGESSGEDLSELAEETIWSKLRDRIFDSTMTIVFISPGMKESWKAEKDQWIPWEVSFSLRTTTRKKQNGDTYTSREIHTQFGMGFGVCGECYEHEWARELKAKRARGEI